ncbi:MAG: RNA polymerase sigma factor [Planctomycetota bacterium]
MAAFSLAEPLDDARTTQLIGAVRAGEVHAWAEIDRRYRKRLSLIVSARLPGGTRGRYDTEDLVQSTLLSAFKELDTFRATGEGSFRRWLTTILRNRLVSRFRYERTLKRDLTADVDDDSALELVPIMDEASQTLERAEELARTIDEASQLDSEHFELIRRHFIEGLSLSEIARRDGVPLTNLRRKMGHALQALRVRMRGQGS